MATDLDPLPAALEAAAAAADESARGQRQVAGIARRLARSQRREASPATAETVDQLHRIIDLMTDSLRLLGSAVSDLRREWIKAMAAEGLRIREIGRVLGVSHQRVAVLRNRSGGSRGTSGVRADH